ncbi:MAG: DoxX family protein [Patescibacteria group bacterium]
MTKAAKVYIVLLRLFLGCFFLYAGLSKLLGPTWSAAGYLGTAKTFSGFYSWLATSGNIGWVNFANEWALTLLGVALILGIFVRLASGLGIVLMVLYYLLGLNFPYAGQHGYIIDEHIIYITLLLLFIAVKAGEKCGIDAWLVALWPRKRGSYLR